MLVSKPFSDILSARRQTFNNLVGGARASSSNFDTEAFSEFLANEVDTIVGAIWDVDPDRAQRTAEDIFEMAVKLVAQNRAGLRARDGLINQIWRDVAPRIPNLILMDPLESLGALTNSATYVSGLRGLRADEWLRTLRDFAPKLDSISDLRHLVTLVTWRSGGAHIRNAALAAAAKLPAELVSAVIGLPKKAGVKDSLTALDADIWWTPDTADASQVHAVGGFDGFGGPFNAPPDVRAVDNGFLVCSANRYFHLSADAFGAIILSAQEADWSDAEAGPSKHSPKNLSVLIARKHGIIARSMLEEGLKLCANPTSFAIASPHSHFIHVLPRRGAL